MTKILTDDVIEKTTDELLSSLGQLRREFNEFKIKRNLRSREALDALDDALSQIGSEIGYLSHQYWSFMRKLKAADRHMDVFDHINNWLGWLTIEFDGKKNELLEAYPVLNE
jgi:hypothetical protein